MAKAKKTGDSVETKTDEVTTPATEPMPPAVEAETKPAAPANEPKDGGLTAEKAAKLVTGTVRTPALDKKGKPISKGGVFEIDEHAIGAADILAFGVRDGKVVVVTVDGQKITGRAA